MTLSISWAFFRREYRFAPASPALLQRCEKRRGALDQILLERPGHGDHLVSPPVEEELKALQASNWRFRVGPFQGIEFRRPP